MKHPLYPLLACYTAGLIFAHWIPLAWISSSTPWILLLLAFFATGLLYFRKYQPVTITLLVAVLILGISRYTLSQKLSARHLIHFMEDNQVVTLEGWLYKPREEFPDRDQLYLEVEKLEMGSLPQVVEGKVRVTVRKVPTTHIVPDLQYGDRVRVRTRLRVPVSYQNPGTFDYKTHLAHQGIYLIGYLSHYSPYLLQRLETGGGSWLYRWIFKLRRQMLTFLASYPAETYTQVALPAEAHFHEKREFLAGKGIQEDLEGEISDNQRIERESGILQAMILGNKTSLNQELQESFRLSGLYHLLVVSGGNIGILAGFLFILFKFLKILSRALLLGIIGLVFLYAFLTGFEPPIVRASFMATIFLLAILFDRDADPFYSLAASALIILIIEPLSLFEASFQLTMTATAAILYAYPFLPKGRENLWEKLKGSFLGMVIMTTAATLGTAPLIIYYFNHFYPYGLLANIPALPLSGLILPLGLLACILNFFLSPLAQALLTIDRVLARGLIYLSDFTANLPYSEWVVSTRFLVPLLLSYLVFFGIFHGLKRSPFQKTLFTTGIIFWIFFIYIFLPQLFPSPLRVTFLDVGQGDSTVIEFPNGTILLIDGGGSPYGSKFDVGRSILAPYLWYQGVTQVDILMISHPHAEHFQGFKYIVEKFKVGAVWSSPWESQNKAYQELLRIIARKGIPYFKIEQGYRQKFGDVEVQILHPSSSYSSMFTQTSHHLENNNSLVLRLTYKNFCFLFPGDIEREAEQFLLQGEYLQPCTILKAPHHGSTTSSSQEFLEALQPSIAVISAGKDGRFEHTGQTVLKRYQKAGIKTYQTREDGAIRIETDGTTYKIKTFREGF